MWWLVIKAIFAILPAVIEAVRENRIKRATLHEVENALLQKHAERILRTIDARDNGTTDSVSDPFNRDGRD